MNATDEDRTAEEKPATESNPPADTAVASEPSAQPAASSEVTSPEGEAGAPAGGSRRILIGSQRNPAAYRAGKNAIGRPSKAKVRRVTRLASDKVANLPIVAGTVADMGMEQGQGAGSTEHRARNKEQGARSRESRATRPHCSPAYSRCRYSAINTGGADSASRTACRRAGRGC